MSRTDGLEEPKPEDPTCGECGYPKDSFACHIRHLQINTGWAKARFDLGETKL